MHGKRTCGIFRKVDETELARFRSLHGPEGPDEIPFQVQVDGQPLACLQILFAAFGSEEDPPRHCYAVLMEQNGFQGDFRLGRPGSISCNANLVLAGFKSRKAGPYQVSADLERIHPDAAIFPGNRIGPIDEGESSPLQGFMGAGVQDPEGDGGTGRGRIRHLVYGGIPFLLIAAK
jgi:hypothetical protein